MVCPTQRLEFGARHYSSTRQRDRAGDVLQVSDLEKLLAVARRADHLQPGEQPGQDVDLDHRRKGDSDAMRQGGNVRLLFL